MRKSRGIFIVLAVAILAAAAGAFIAVRTAAANQSKFYSSGYVLRTDTTDESVEVSQVQFASGTAMKAKYPSSVAFKDVQGTETVVSEDTYIFYDDGSISALTDGSLIDLDEVRGGVVDYYYLTSKMVLEYGGGNEYTIDNNDTALSFTNYLWKISDDSWLVSAEKMELILNNQSIETIENAYFQVTYLESQLVRVTDGTNVWQSISTDGCIILGNGLQIDLFEKEIQDEDGETLISLEDVEIDSQSGVAVASTTADSWTPPTFNFNVTNGTDGESGGSGESGESGTSGDGGDSGEEGSSGEAGATGEAGEAGSTGGTSGTSSSSSSSASTSTMPTFHLSALDYDCSEVSFTVTVSGDTDILGMDGAIEIYRVSDNTLVAYTNGIDFAQYEDSGYTFDLVDADWYQYLSADTEYRIVVSSSYTLNDGTTGTKDFLTRTFYTSAVGTSVSLDYSTDGTLSLAIDTKSYSEMTYGAIRYTYTDASGTVQTLWYGGSSGSSSEPYVLDLSTVSEVTLTDLPSDTLVTVEYYVTSGNTLIASGENANIELAQTEEFYTLKATPTVETLSISTNSNYLALYCEDITDVDQAITGYRYEIYQYESNGDTTIVKTLTASDESPVALYLSDTITANNFYCVKAYAIYYDNYETEEILVGGEAVDFDTYSVGTPIIWFEPAEESEVQSWSGGALTDAVGFNYIYGTLCIDGNGTNIATGAGNSILITIESGSDWAQDMVYKFDVNEVETGGTIRIPIELQGLKEDSSYRFAVSGYLQDENGTVDTSSTYLGNCAVQTEEAGKLYCTLEAITDDGELMGSSFGVKITLLDDNNGSGKAYTAGDTISTEMASLSALRVALYVGGSYLTEYVWPTTESSNYSYYSTELCSYYMEGNQITILGNNFDVTNLSGEIMVKVEGGYDYTWWGSDFDGNKTGSYVNEIEIESEEVSLTIQPSAPALPDADDGVKVTTLYNGTVGQLTGDSSEKDDDLQDDTVAGFYLEAVYDNTSHLAQSVIYYGFRAVDYDDFYSTENVGSNVSQYGDICEYIETSGCTYDTTFTVTIPAGDGTALNGLYVVFTDDTDKINSCLAADGSYTATKTSDGSYILYLNEEKFGRGNHYYFAYKAMLTLTMDADSVTATYVYPDNLTGGGYTAGMILKSQLAKAPKESPTVEVWLDHTTKYTASWNYTITDPDDTIWVYQTETTYNSEGYDTSSWEEAYYGDLQANTGKPLILAALNSTLANLPYVPLDPLDTSSEGTKAADTAVKAAGSSMAWISFSDTATDTSTGVAVYTGTVTAGDGADTDDYEQLGTRKSYLYRNRSLYANSQPYYFALRRDLYFDGYGDGAWEESYLEFGGHLFDYYDEDELTDTSSTASYALTPTGTQVVGGTQTLELTYNVSEAAVRHILGMRVQLTLIEDNQAGGTAETVCDYVTLPYTYDSSTSTLTVQVDVEQCGKGLGTYKVEAYAIYDTGVSGLSYTVLGASTVDAGDESMSDAESAFNTEYRDQTAGAASLPASGLAIQTLTGREYAYSETTSNSVANLVFSSTYTSSDYKRYYVVSSDTKIGGTTTVGTSSAYVDRRLSVSRYGIFTSSIGFAKYWTDATNGTAQLNLVYTEDGAQIYGTSYYPVFKKLAVAQVDTDPSGGNAEVTVSELYPSITNLYSQSGYPSFGHEQIRFFTSSADMILNSSDTYSSYMYAELYKLTETGNGGSQYVRVENQENYFESTVSLTVGNRTYTVPAVQMVSGQTSYELGLKNLDYGATYEVRWYVLPAESTLANLNADDFETASGSGQLYLKKFLITDATNGQLVKNSLSSTNKSNFDIVRSYDADNTTTFSTTTDDALTGVCLRFTTPEKLTIETLTAEYKVSGYSDSDRSLEISFQTDEVNDFLLKFEIYDSTGTSCIYSYSDIMEAAGYTAYDANGDEVTDPSDNVLYTWKDATGTEFSYSTVTQTLSLSGLELTNGTQYILRVTTYYEPTVESGEIVSSSKYTAGTADGYVDITDLTFVRNDQSVDPIYTLSISSALDDQSVATLTIKHQVRDTTYRLSGGTYSIYIVGPDGVKTLLRETCDTNNSTVTISLDELGTDSSSYKIVSGETYSVQIWGMLDGATEAELLYSMEKTVVGSSGVDIDTSSMVVQQMSSGALTLLMYNSSGLDAVTSVSYTIYPLILADGTSDELANKYLSSSNTKQTGSVSLFSAIGSCDSLTLSQVSSYLSDYTVGDTFAIQVVFMQDSTQLATVTKTFSKMY